MNMMKVQMGRIELKKKQIRPLSVHNYPFPFSEPTWMKMVSGFGNIDENIRREVFHSLNFQIILCCIKS